MSNVWRNMERLKCMGIYSVGGVVACSACTATVPLDCSGGIQPSALYPCKVETELCVGLGFPS
jgi:hypothetical protein